MLHILYPSPYGGETYDLTFAKAYYANAKGNYVSNRSLAIEVLYHDEEYDCDMPFARLTVNLNDKNLKPNQAYVDTNNTGNLIDYLEAEGVAKFAGVCKPSGYCLYPLYEFDELFLKTIA